MDEDQAAVPRIGVPRGLAERAREFAATGRTPAVPRDAATVILLRQAPDVEAFLLRRTDALEFAPGACVFPGGSVDQRDSDGQLGWAGRSPAEFAGWLNTSAERARALVCAAVRETFEESGVLLAGPSPTELVQDSETLALDRRALLEGSCSLAELLGRRGLVLRADLLTPWARWVTPEFSPRRFDTWFFASPMPPGQVTAVTGGPEHQPAESVSGSWLKPSEALEAARAGQITLLPPTAVTLAELTGHQDVAGILAQRRVITPVLPRVVVEQERTWLALPEATKYPL
jgi:8-oxo-dGTP pyrophosphatase MutT (NUDIX family)